MIAIFEKSENIFGKRENAGCQFLTLLWKDSSLGNVKHWIVLKRDNGTNSKGHFLTLKQTRLGRMEEKRIVCNILIE